MRNVGWVLLSVILFGINISVLWMWESKLEPKPTEQDAAGTGRKKMWMWMKDRKWQLVWLAGSILLSALSIRVGMQLSWMTWLAQCKRVVLMTVLAAAAVIDFREKLIPNRLLLVGILYRVLLLLGEMIWERENLLGNLFLELCGAMAIFLICMLFLLFMKNSIGMGDIKLFMMMGLYLGLFSMGNAIMTSLILIFFYALFLLITRKKGKKDVLPFAPAVFIGTYLAIFLAGI